MKKIKAFLQAPVTWGGYLKLCLVCCIIAVGEMAYWWKKYFTING